KGLLLKGAATEQEENQSGQGIEIPFAAAGTNLESALGKQRRQPERNRHIQRQHALAQGGQRALPIIRRAVDQHRQRQRQAQISEDSPKNRAAEAVQAQIQRDAEQHDVAERETGHAKLQPTPPAFVVDRL